MENSKSGGLAVVAVAVFLVPVLIVVVLFLGTSGAASTGGVCGVPGAPGTVPSGTKKVSGFSGDQLQNAATIMGAASGLKLPVSAQIIGVQTAIGESTLQVIDRGDAAGPDSRGLFQQRANGAWGSYKDRMDPRTSATNFFKALQRVKGWQDLEPTEVIHRVQGNADPNHYTPFRAPAAAIVKALSGADLEDIDANGTCPDTAAAVIGELGSGQWSSPLPGATITSGFGGRACPAGASCNVNTTDHKGVDLAGGSGTDVLAPTDMKITVTEQGQGWKAGYGTYVIAQQVEEPGLVFEFHHMVHGSLKVKAGDTVAAGTPLGTVGTTGNSTGVHLHFQVASPGTSPDQPTFKHVIDPTPILKAKGVL